jgi:hypothetical protein
MAKSGARLIPRVDFGERVAPFGLSNEGGSREEKEAYKLLLYHRILEREIFESTEKIRAEIYLIVIHLLSDQSDPSPKHPHTKSARPSDIVLHASDPSSQSQRPHCTRCRPKLLPLRPCNRQISQIRILRRRVLLPVPMVHHADQVDQTWFLSVADRFFPATLYFRPRSTCNYETLSEPHDRHIERQSYGLRGSETLSGL